MRIIRRNRLAVGARLLLRHLRDAGRPMTASVITVLPENRGVAGLNPGRPTV